MLNKELKENKGETIRVFVKDQCVESEWKTQVLCFRLDTVVRTLATGKVSAPSVGIGLGGYFLSATVI